MKIKIEPSFLNGEITPPPSKSMLHRAIICASLSSGQSIIKNVNYSKDIVATINAFVKAGIDMEQNENSLTIKSNGTLRIAEGDIVDCNESGSTLRFLIPVFTQKDKSIHFTGKESLMKRPLSIYKDIYLKAGNVFDLDGKLLNIVGELKAGEYNIPGNVSSQFISGLLFHLPRLKDNSRINIIGKLESENYVKMTIDMLLKFGIKIFGVEGSYIIPGGQKYVHADVKIEADFSQMAFYAVAGILNGNITINNINLNSLQGDNAIVKIIADAKGHIKFNKGSITTEKSKTYGMDIDISQIPDLAPILGVLLSYSSGKSRLLNTQRLVFKESNRLISTFETLVKLGVSCKIVEDTLEIEETKIFKGGVFETYNDHRIAMMVSIASLCADQPIIIRNAEVINKSYPNFYRDFMSLGGKITYIEE